jgi:hypothetical protein
MKEPTQNRNDLSRTPVVPNEKKLDTHPELRARLEGIQDPLKRYAEASKVANKGYLQSQEMVQIRIDRRKAIVALGRHHGWGKAEIARHIGARDRRVVDACFKLPDLRDIKAEWIFDENSTPEERKLAEERAAKAAKELHAEYTERATQGVTAREMRRILILELTTGKYGKLYQNNELAEKGDTSPALIAQNRTGSSNKTKPAAREAAREAKRRAQESGNVAA